MTPHLANTWDTVTTGRSFQERSLRLPAHHGVRRQWKGGTTQHQRCRLRPHQSEQGSSGPPESSPPARPVSVTNGDGSAAGNPTIAFSTLTGLTGNRTPSQPEAAPVWFGPLTFPAPDPVLTIGSGVFNVTTGSLQVGGVDVVTTSGSQVFT